MASLQLRGKSWRLLFNYGRQQHSFPLGEVEEVEAHAWKGKVELLLLRLKQGLLQLPPGCPIASFLQHDGKPPDRPGAAAPPEITLAQLRDDYLRVHAQGSLEKSTLATVTLHFKHLVRLLGCKVNLNSFNLKNLQSYVERRSREENRCGRPVSQATVRMEVITLRTAWNWAVLRGDLTGRFPGRGLRYGKEDEKPPFMTWQQIERQVAAGGDSRLWDCLYLTAAEIADLLAHVRANATAPFLYPMFCLAAHTGARRSEMLRAEAADVNFADNTVTVRERKRVKGVRSTRRVPLSPLLAETLKAWLAAHPGGRHLFGPARRGPRREEGAAPASITRNKAHDHFTRTLQGSRWEVVKGWHVLRHSFISACASRGVDQRFIDEWVGHTTDQMRRRYRHLWPSTQQDAINLVFGGQ